MTNGLKHEFSCFRIGVYFLGRIRLKGEQYKHRVTKIREEM